MSSNYGQQFMTCPNCGALAGSEAVNVGVGLYIKGDYACSRCDWDLGGPSDFGFVEMEAREFAPPESSHV